MHNFPRRRSPVPFVVSESRGEGRGKCEQGRNPNLPDLARMLTYAALRNTHRLVTRGRSPGSQGRFNPVKQRLPMWLHSGILLLTYPAYRCGGSVGIDLLFRVSPSSHLSAAGRYLRCRNSNPIDRTGQAKKNSEPEISFPVSTVQLI